MTEGGGEIIKLGGTTFCLCSLVYVCDSGNSAGLMLGNYTPPQATATLEQAQFPQSRRTSIIHNMFFCDDTAGGCQSFKRLFELPDHVTPQSPPQHTTTKRVRSFQKVCFWDGLCPEDESFSMGSFWPISDLPAVFIGKCSHISVLHL